MNASTHTSVIRSKGISTKIRTPQQVADETLALLEREGPLTRTQITVALGTNRDRMGEAIDILVRGKRIESYRALSARKRMDEFWCLKGRSPVGKPQRERFNATAILADFQRASLAQQQGART